jgi:hypothetical protein
MKITLVLLATLLAVAFAAPVRFAIIGDRTGSHVEGVYGRVVAEVEALEPEFVITVGDQIEGYTEDTVRLREEWAEYDSIVAGLSMPLYLVPGNHDITFDGMEPFFERHSGRKPYYSFDHAGLHVVVLDNSRRESGQGLDDAQFAWLEQDLASARETRTATLVFMHKPFWYELAARGRPDPLHELFRSGGVTAVFSGHYHQYFSGVIDGISYTSIGSSGGGTVPGPTGIEYHYALVTVDGGALVVEPILPGGETRPWDDVTVADMLAIERNERTGMRFLEPLPLGRDLTAEGVVRLEIRNPVAGAALADTLRWDLPEGWTAVPDELPVELAAGAARVEEFTVGCVGEPFPPPSVTLRFPYSPQRSHEVTGLLHVARTASCPAAGEAPAVDGSVTEPCWRDPETALFAYGGGRAQTDPAEFRFCHDAGNLYVAAVCRDASPDSIVARVTERDGAVYGEDCVGFFLQPDTAVPVVYQVYFSALGAVFDQRIEVREDGQWDSDVGWNGDCEVAAARRDDGWSIEARLPLADLGNAAPAGAWGLNFRRKQPRLGNGDWQVPISYDPGTFGRLQFRPR